MAAPAHPSPLDGDSAPRMLGYLPPYWEASTYMREILQAEGTELDSNASYLSAVPRATTVYDVPPWAVSLWEYTLYPDQDSLLGFSEYDRARLVRAAGLPVRTPDQVAEYVAAWLQVDAEYVSVTIDGEAALLEVDVVTEATDDQMASVRAAVERIRPLHMDAVVNNSGSSTVYPPVHVQVFDTPGSIEQWERPANVDGCKPYTEVKFVLIGGGAAGSTGGDGSGTTGGRGGGAGGRVARRWPLSYIRMWTSNWTTPVEITVGKGGSAEPDEDFWGTASTVRMGTYIDPYDSQIRPRGWTAQGGGANGESDNRPGGLGSEHLGNEELEDSGVGVGQENAAPAGGIGGITSARAGGEGEAADTGGSYVDLGPGHAGNGGGYRAPGGSGGGTNGGAYPSVSGASGFTISTLLDVLCEYHEGDVLITHDGESTFDELSLGCAVEGPGIQPGSVVASIVSPTEFTLSLPPTETHVESESNNAEILVVEPSQVNRRILPSGGGGGGGGADQAIPNSDGGIGGEGGSPGGGGGGGGMSRGSGTQGQGGNGGRGVVVVLTMASPWPPPEWPPDPDAP